MLTTGMRTLLLGTDQWMGARNDAASVLPRVFPVTQKTLFLEWECLPWHS